MKYRLLGLVLVLFVFNSCEDGGSSSQTGTTGQGFKFDYHIKGKGEKPQHKDFVSYHITVKSGDKVLQSSYDRGAAVLKVNNTGENKMDFITDALTQMTEGDSVSLYYPVDSLGPRKPPGIVEGEEFLVCDLKLNSIMDSLGYIEYSNEMKAEQEKELMKVKVRLPEVSDLVNKTITDYKAGGLDNIQKTESGLEYVIHEAGSGEQAHAGDQVVVQYYGALKSDMSSFDASFNRGTGIPFKLGTGAVIRGWDEGIALLKEGDKATFFIPYSLAYGEAGRPPSIPAKSDLVFYVELESVQH